MVKILSLTLFPKYKIQVGVDTLLRIAGIQLRLHNSSKLFDKIGKKNAWENQVFKRLTVSWA